MNPLFSDYSNIVQFHSDNGYFHLSHEYKCLIFHQEQIFHLPLETLRFIILSSLASTTLFSIRQENFFHLVRFKKINKKIFKN